MPVGKKASRPYRTLRSNSEVSTPLFNLFIEKMQTIMALLMDLQGKSGGGGPSASMMSQFAKKK